MKYEKIVFYGDSFTWGQDSGGDGIRDESKTYPTLIGNMLSKCVVNNACPGYSNLGMLYKMIEYTNYCLGNEDSDTFPKTLNIINLTSSLRGTITNSDKLESDNYPYGCDLSNGNLDVTRFKVFGPNYPEDAGTTHLNNSMSVYYRESDMRICLDQYMIMLAIKDLADRYKMGLVFVDVLFEKHLLEVTNKFNFHNIGCPIVDFNVENFGKTQLISTAPCYLETSKTGHFYEEGYKWMADTILAKLQAECPHIFLD